MRRFGIGHNGGPPLEPNEHAPPWGARDPFVYFAWVEAHRRAWRHLPWDTMMRRQRRAEALGLSYEEYTLEILERGRHLSSVDVEAIAAVKARRPRPHVVEGSHPVADASFPTGSRIGAKPDGISPLSPAWGLVARARRRQRRA